MGGPPKVADGECSNNDMVCFTKWRKNWVSAAAIAHWSAVHMIYTPWPSVFKEDTQCVR